MRERARVGSCLAALWLAVVAADGTQAGEDRGWLVGGGWGGADHRTSVAGFDDGSITDGSVDNDELAWKLFAGYRFHRWFSIEAGYADLENDFDRPTFEGTSDGTGTMFVSAPGGPVSVGLKPEAVFAEGVGSLPIVRRARLFGKLGVARWRTETTISDLRGQTATERDGTDLIYGAGFEYRFDFGLAVRAELEVFDEIGEHRIRMGSIGLTWAF